MDSDTKKYFQGFREWLIVNEGMSPERSYTVASNLRTIEEATIDEYTHGQKITPLHQCYKSLSDASQFNKKDRDKNILEVKKTIGAVYKTVIENRGRTGYYNNWKKAKIDNCRTALLQYVNFLDETFGFFTLDDLVKEGLIKRERKHNSKIPSGKRFSGDIIRKGITQLLRKCSYRIFAEGDNKMIAFPLDKFHEVMDAYAELHGAKAARDLFQATSFICKADNPCTDWEIVFASNLQLYVEGSQVGTYYEMVKYCYHPEKNELETYDMDGNIDILRPLILSARDPQKRELNVRVISSPSVYEQAQILNDLRQLCSNIASLVKEYTISVRPKLDLNERKEKTMAALKHIDFLYLASIANEALSLIKEYASSYHVELVSE